VKILRLLSVSLTLWCVAETTLIGNEPAADSLPAGQTAPVSTTLNVRDFGALGDGVHDDAPAFRLVLEELSRIAGAKTLLIPSGTYLLMPEKGASGNAAHLLIADQHDLTVSGAPGTLLIMGSAFHSGVIVNKCQNVRLESFAVDYLPLPFTQGTIIGTTPGSHTFTVRLDPGFPRSTDPQITSGSDTKNIAYLYDPKTGLKLDQFYDQYLNKIETLKNDEVLLTSHGPIEPAFTGNKVVIVGRRKADAVVFSSSTRCTASHITVYSSPALGFGLRSSDFITVDSCTITQRPGSGRLMSTNADGIHVKWGTHGPTILNCHLTGMGDDSVNIGGTYQYIYAQPDDHTLIVDRHGSLTPGKNIRLVRNLTGAVVSLPSCTTVRGLTYEDHPAMRLTFAGALPAIERTVATAGADGADLVINYDQVAANPVIRGNFFGSHRERGVLVQAPGVLIEDNHFENLLGPAIRIGHHYGGRTEGPNGTGCIIRNNTFINIRRSVICVLDDGPPRDCTLPQLSIENIEITGNHFSLFGQPSAHGAGTPGNVIWIDNAKHVLISDNSIGDPYPGTPDVSLITINQAADVTISGTILEGKSAKRSDWLNITSRAEKTSIHVR
jgi:hypothetical protein